jgi:glucose dehydrogenase
MYRGNYQGWGYSPLDKINKANVKNLQLALVARDGARLQRDHAYRLQWRDVSG